MLLAQAEVMLIVGAAIFVLAALICFAIFFRFGSLWFQAYMSGVPLRLTELIGMSLRKVDVRAVIRTLIMATQAGVPLSRVDVERAYLQGVDIEKITLAMIRAKKEGIEVTFQDLVDAEMENRLEEKLSR